jgi:hypothetical protein
MAKISNILFYVGGAALVYYLINKNKPAAPLPTTLDKSSLAAPISTINNLIQSASGSTDLPTAPQTSAPIVIQSKAKGGAPISAVQSGSSVDGAIYTAIVPTVLGPLPISATENFLASNTPAVLSNLAVTNNLLTTGTLLESTINTGSTVTQLAAPMKSGNNMTTIQKGYL